MGHTDILLFVVVGALVASHSSCRNRDAPEVKSPAIPVLSADGGATDIRPPSLVSPIGVSPQLDATPQATEAPAAPEGRTVGGGTSGAGRSFQPL